MPPVPPFNPPNPPIFEEDGDDDHDEGDEAFAFEEDFVGSFDGELFVGVAAIAAVVGLVMRSSDTLRSLVTSSESLERALEIMPSLAYALRPFCGKRIYTQVRKAQAPQNNGVKRWDENHYKATESIKHDPVEQAEYPHIGSIVMGDANYYVRL